MSEDDARREPGVEYKELWHDKYLEWICGYANAKGGLEVPQFFEHKNSRTPVNGG